MSKHKILVVDDEADICSLVSDILSATGEFDVVITNDPVKVEEICFSEKPDLILMDVVMPVRRGPEVAKALKSDSKTSDIPIVIMSGLGEMVYLKDKKKWDWLPNRPIVKQRGDVISDPHDAVSGYGVEGYIEKPFNSANLIREIKTHLK